MVTNPKLQLINYLRKNLAKGYTLDSLRIALIRQGYSVSIIEKAIGELNKEMSKKAPVFKEKPRIRYQIIDEKDEPIKFKKPFWKRIFG
jgi:hypothetical protein